MTDELFSRIFSELAGAILRNEGFTNQGSSLGVFYRRIDTEVVHIVMPSRGSSSTVFEIHVFPTSSFFYPDFDFRFPDDIPITTDIWSYLHDEFGIGDRRAYFSCRSREHVVRSCNQRVVPALKQFALPFLNQFDSIGSMVPVLKSKIALGLALFHAGRERDARKVLIAEVERLEALANDLAAHRRRYIQEVTGI